MSGAIFQRSMDVVKTRSEAQGDSPPPCPAPTHLPPPSTAASSLAFAEERPALSDVRRELEELKRHRAALEAQRQRLLEERLVVHREAKNGGCAVGSTAHFGGHNAAWSASGLTSTRQHSELGSLAAPSTPASSVRQRYVDSTVVANMSAIPSESSRRQHLKPTPQLGMKSALREAAAHDSTLLMGDFLLEDNPHTCTFGRERRFRAVVGQRGKYYLSTDVGVEQLLNRDHLDFAAHQRVAQRFGQTPGPGAYTPRYNKVSRPPPQL